MDDHRPREERMLSLEDAVEGHNGGAVDPTDADTGSFFTDTDPDTGRHH